MAKAKKVVQKQAKVPPTPQPVEHKTNDRHKPSFIGGAVIAFVIIAAINFVRGFMLTPVWTAMEVAGVLRGGMQNQSLAGFIILEIIVALALVWIVRGSKAQSRGQAFLLGLVLSLLPSFIDVSTFLFYRTPGVIPLTAVACNLIGFGIAAAAVWRKHP